METRGGQPRAVAGTPRGQGRGSLSGKKDTEILKIPKCLRGVLRREAFIGIVALPAHCGGDIRPCVPVSVRACDSACGVHSSGHESLRPQNHSRRPVLCGACRQYRLGRSDTPNCRPSSERLPVVFSYWRFDDGSFAKHRLLQFVRERASRIEWFTRSRVGRGAVVRSCINQSRAQGNRHLRDTKHRDFDDGLLAHFWALPVS